MHTKADLRLVELAEAAAPRLAMEDAEQAEEDGQSDEAEAANSGG